MKKKWLAPAVVVSAIGTSLYLFKKFKGNKLSNNATHRTKLITYFEEKGYKVHCYNDNNDFMLFHPTRNEMKHVFFADGEVSMMEFQKKVETYYYNFTNSFYFISKNEATSKSTFAIFQGWKNSLDEHDLSKYGVPHGEFYIAEHVLKDEVDTWKY